MNLLGMAQDFGEWSGGQGRCPCKDTLRVQVPNNHILTQNLYYNSYYPKPKYLIIGYMDPLGYKSHHCSGCGLKLLWQPWDRAPDGPSALGVWTFSQVQRIPFAKGPSTPIIRL